MAEEELSEGTHRGQEDFVHVLDAFSGAGRQEAPFLSAVLVGDPGCVIVLDEPGAHTEPTLQRRLTQTVDNDIQRIVITPQC